MKRFERLMMVGALGAMVFVVPACGDEDTSSTVTEDVNTETATEGGMPVTEAGGMPVTEAGEEPATEAGDESATEGGDESASEAGDESASEAGDESAGEAGDESASEAGDETGTEAGDETGTEAGDETASEAGDETGTEAGDESTTEGGGESATEEGDEAGTEAGDEAATEEGDESATEEGDEAGTEAGEEAGDEATTEEGEEIATTEGGDTATCFESLNNLKSGTQGAIDVDLCDLLVNYVSIYTDTVVGEDGTESEVMTKFVYFVTADDGEGNQTAVQFYVEPGVTGQDENGEDIEGFPYDPPAVGSVINIKALSYGEYQGLNNISESTDLEVVSVENTIVSIDLDQDPIVPSEEFESFVVTGKSITILGGDTNEFGQIVSDTISVDYGAGEVQVYGGKELEEVLAASPVCAGGTLELAGGVITQYQDIHQIRVYDAINEVSVTGGTCATYDDSNWGFEDMSTSNPPAGFIKKTSEFDALTSMIAYTGAAGCELNWYSTDNQDFLQGFYVEIAAGQKATFDLYIWDADVNGRLRQALTFYDAEGNSLGNKFPSAYSDDVTNNETGWFMMTYSFEAPENAASVRGWVRMYDVGAWPEDGEATVVIDDWNVYVAN